MYHLLDTSKAGALWPLAKAGPTIDMMIRQIIRSGRETQEGG